MDPVKLSAQFAAFVWFTNRAGGTASTNTQAWAYARKHWQSFLPAAHDGLGRLLLKIARGRSRRLRARERALVPAVAS
jgi:hypothetical protein